MNHQQAIKWLKAIQATQGTSINKNSLSERKEALHMGIEALEKSDKKKVSNRKILRDFNERPYAIEGDCPVCGKRLLSSNTDYCNICGQKLNWREEEIGFCK